MGDLGDGRTDTLDERLWGDEEDEEDEEASEKEEESGQGMDQVELDIRKEHLQCRTHDELLLFCSHENVCHMISGRVGAGGQRRQLGRRRPQQGEENRGQRSADGYGGEGEDQRAGRPGDPHHSRALFI